jgi:hypothetical protein
MVFLDHVNLECGADVDRQANPMRGVRKAKFAAVLCRELDRA